MLAIVQYGLYAPSGGEITPFQGLEGLSCIGFRQMVVEVARTMQGVAATTILWLLLAITCMVGIHYPPGLGVPSNTSGFTLQ